MGFLVRLHMYVRCDFDHREMPRLEYFQQTNIIYSDKQIEINI